MFAQSMRGKWDDLVYIDLFAGAGRAKIRGTSRIVRGSPLAVLNNAAHFTRYIFAEVDPTRVSALETRIEASHSNRETRFVQADANEAVDEVLGHIPRATRAHKVLCFSFADPCNLKNLHFETIRSLSKRYVDHLVLIPTGMDANRNMSHHYSKASNPVLDKFLGDSDWRPAWEGAQKRGESPDIFLTREFGSRMVHLEYLDPGIDRTHLIKSDEKNLSLYRLALYSRHPLAQKFWKETRKYSVPQGTFPFTS